MLNWLLGWFLGAKQQLPQPTVLHKAEEYGQSRPLSAAEVWACALMALLKGLFAGVMASLIYVVGAYLLEEYISILTSAIVLVAGFLASWGAQLYGDLDDLVDGLRSYRSVETYAPPTPQLEPPTPAPDIVVHPYRRDPYTMVRGAGPGQVTSPSPEQRRAITRPVIAAAIQASIENEGIWSRSTITGITVGSQTITRGMWKKLTAALQGILIRQPDGSHRLPPDVHTFEDATRYVEGLAPLSSQTGQKTLPPARPPACPPACPPAHPRNGDGEGANPGHNPTTRQRVIRSRRDLFVELGHDARWVVEARKKKEQENER